jgi:outer membrane lipoprotein-sorting protein
MKLQLRKTVKSIAVFWLLISFCPAYASEKVFRSPPSRIRKVLRAFQERERYLASGLENVQCVGQIEVEIAGQKITEKAKLALKMPDKLRVEIVESNIPLFQGWVIIRNGDRAFTYDPLGERTAEIDLKGGAEKDQARLDTTFTIWALFFRQSLYDIRYVESNRRAGRTAHRLALILRRPVFFKLWLLKRSEVLVDDSTGRPLRESMFDVEGREVLELNYADPVKVKPGLVAPRKVEGRDKAGTRFRAHLTWVQKKALVPVKIEFENPQIGLNGQIRYSDFVLNRPIPDEEFAPAG